MGLPAIDPGILKITKLPDEADPVIKKRFDLATACVPRHRILAEAYVKTHDKKAALQEAGYRTKLKKHWLIVSQKPEFIAYVTYLEERRLMMPDEDWCIEKLKNIVDNVKSPATAKVAAIGMIGKIRKVPGLCAEDEEVGTSGNAPVVKVIIGVDPKDI